MADDGASFENLDEVDHVVGCVQHQAAAHNVAQPFEVSAVRAIHLRALVTSEKNGSALKRVWDAILRDLSFNPYLLYRTIHVFNRPSIVCAVDGRCSELGGEAAERRVDAVGRLA